MPIYTKQSIPIKIPMVFFAEIEKSILKFIWNFKWPWITKISSKKNKIRGLTFLGFKVYYKTTVTKQCDTGIKTDIQTNGVEQRAKKTNPYVNWSLANVPRSFNRKKSVTSTNDAGKTISTSQRMRLDSYFKLCTKLSQNGLKTEIKDLKTKPSKIKS